MGHRARIRDVYPRAKIFIALPNHKSRKGTGTPGRASYEIRTPHPRYPSFAEITVSLLRRIDEEPSHPTESEQRSPNSVRDRVRVWVRVGLVSVRRHVKKKKYALGTICRMAEVCRKGTLGSMLARRAASLLWIRLLFVFKPPL